MTRTIQYSFRATWREAHQRGKSGDPIWHDFVGKSYTYFDRAYDRSEGLADGGQLVLMAQSHCCKLADDETMADLEVLCESRPVMITTKGDGTEIKALASWDLIVSVKPDGNGGTVLLWPDTGEVHEVPANALRALRRAEPS